MSEQTDKRVREASRRHFLQAGAALAGGSAVAGLESSRVLAESGNNLPPNVPEWMKAPGDPMGSQPYGTPSVHEKGVVKNISKTLQQYISASGRTPLQELDGIITPNGLFYERHHGGVPTIDPAEHRLMLHGMVDRPLVFTMEDIRRFPSQSRIHFLECSGNPVYTKPYGKTASDLVGLLSCAEWTGVPLKTVLDEAGVQAGAKWIVAEGADAAALTRSIPIEKCLDDAMLVYSQNGERLRPQQGYPLRLLLPGFEGNMNVKWLRRLKVVAEPAYSREETSKYTDPMPDGTAREFTFYMEAKSIITRPSGGQKLSAKGFCEITGLAWSGHGAGRGALRHRAAGDAGGDRRLEHRHRTRRRQPAAGQRQRRARPHRLRRAVCGMSRRQGAGRSRRPAGRRAGHAGEPKTDPHRRQLLALRADAVRLHPPCNAAERAAVAEQ